MNEILKKYKEIEFKPYISLGQYPQGNNNIALNDINEIFIHNLLNYLKFWGEIYFPQYGFLININNIEISKDDKQYDYQKFIDKENEYILYENSLIVLRNITKQVNIRLGLNFSKIIIGNIYAIIHNNKRTKFYHLLNKKSIFIYPIDKEQYDKNKSNEKFIELIENNFKIMDNEINKFLYETIEALKRYNINLWLDTDKIEKKEKYLYVKEETTESNYNYGVIPFIMWNGKPICIPFMIKLNNFVGVNVNDYKEYLNNTINYVRVYAPKLYKYNEKICLKNAETIAIILTLQYKYYERYFKDMVEYFLNNYDKNKNMLCGNVTDKLFWKIFLYIMDYRLRKSVNNRSLEIETYTNATTNDIYIRLNVYYKK